MAKGNPVAVFVVLFLVAMPFANRAHGQVELGGHGLYNTGLGFNSRVADDGAFGLGLRIGSALPAMGMGIGATLNLFFPDCVDGTCTFLDVSGDLRYRIPAESKVRPYLGGGVAFQRSSSLDLSDTGLNCLAGIELPGPFSLNTMLEASYRLMNDFDNQLVLLVGFFDRSRN